MADFRLLDRQVGLPSSYFGFAHPYGNDARYVLVYGAPSSRAEGLRLIYKAERGAVYERPAR
jgi:hypothetical protein